MAGDKTRIREHARRGRAIGADGTAGTPSGRGKAYAQRMIARANELRESDAFAPAETTASAVPFADVMAQRTFTKRRVRQTIAIMVAIIAAVALMSLCLPYYGIDAMGLSGQIYAPADVAACWALWAQTTFGPLFDPTVANRTDAMVQQFAIDHPDIIYQLVIQRGAVTLVVVACGFLLAVSGMLFQTAFRNPLATPSMLGVSDGVTLGCIVFAMLGYYEAADNMPLYLLLVYGCGALAVVAVLVLSRAVSGSAHYNIFDMLLMGTVLCQLLGGISSYITNFGMDTMQWERFYNIQQAGNVLNEPATWIVVGVVFAITLVPTLVLRFKFNLISFDDEEAALMGVRPRLLRGGALVLGSVMQLAAIATIGQVAMLSLAVPFLVRFLMPSEFRYQLLGNALLGTLVLLACIAVQHFTTVGVVTVPVGTVISVLIIPFFVWAVALQRKGSGE